jgi:hypothetical protein
MHWAHGNSLASMFLALFSHITRKNRIIADAMAGDAWIKDMMHSVTPDIVADYISLWMVIDRLNFDPSDTRSDEIVWLWSASGEYMAKSAYHMQFQGSTRSNFKALIWRVWAPSRCKFSIWLMLQNRVWKADRLLRREWPNEYFCPLCIRNLETIAHLLKECPFTRSTWERINSWASLPSLHPQQWDDGAMLVAWFGSLSVARPASAAKGIRSLVTLDCWSVWCERNTRIFQKGERNVDQVVAAIQCEARQWSKAGSKRLGVVIAQSVSG